MVLPASFSTDNQAALDALFGACEADKACAAREPQLRAALARHCWRRCRATVTRGASAHRARRATDADARHAARPGARAAVRAGAGRGAAGRASARPRAGRFEPLAGLARRSAAARHAAGRGHALLGGLRRGRATAGAGHRRAGRRLRRRLRRRCTARSAPAGRAASVPAAFYTLPPAPAATLVLSGGVDPVTPPRHGERVAKALGAKARHVVVPNAGHGVMALGCMRDVLYRFVDAAERRARRCRSTPTARTAIPRPPAFVPVAAARRRRRVIEVQQLAKRFTQGRGAQGAHGAGGGRRQTSRPPTAASPACSAPTAPARPPRCAWLAALIVPDAGRVAGRRHRRRRAAAARRWRAWACSATRAACTRG